MGWRIAAASSIGTSHMSLGLPCQDSHRVELIPTIEGELFVAAISDGAGSATYAQAGSEIAVSKLICVVREFLGSGGEFSAITRTMFCEWFSEVRDEIHSRAKAFDHSAREYACTLLVSMIGPHSAVFAQIGDGAIVVRKREGAEWSPIFWPQHGEYANTTNFIVADDALDLIEFDFHSTVIDEVALFSDGIEDLVLHNATKTAHAPFFDSIILPVRKLEIDGVSETASAGLAAYLASPTICDRTDDDKSLILACRISECLE